MKTWVYQVVFKRGSRELPDQRIFRNKVEAETYAGIELTQMELVGCKYFIRELI